MNKFNNQPPEVSVTFVSDYDLKPYVENAINHHVWILAHGPSLPGAYYNKMQFYFTGVNPLREVHIRNIIKEYRKNLPGYTVRITKRAGFDAMLTITVTRHISKQPRYFNMQR